MIEVREVAYTVMPVRNVATSRTFYEKVLGLTPSHTFPNSAGTWVEYALGPTTLSITDMIDERWQPSSHGAAVALEVEDFDAAIQWLRQHQTTFQTEPWQGAHCRMATVYDPDGNCIAIHRLNERPPEG